MSGSPDDTTGAPAPAEAPTEPNREPSTVEAILGRPPTQAELEESSGYDELRDALRAAREDKGLSQIEIAGLMELGQSEVSRLETSVGPGTRFGRIRNYLNACGAQFEVVVRTSQGREFKAWHDHDSAAAETGSWLGQAAEPLAPDQVLTPFIFAVDDAIQQHGFSVAQARKFRVNLMRQMHHYRQGARLQPAVAEEATVFSDNSSEGQEAYATAEAKAGG